MTLLRFGYMRPTPAGLVGANKQLVFSPAPGDRTVRGQGAPFTLLGDDVRARTAVDGRGFIELAPLPAGKTYRVRVAGIGEWHILLPSTGEVNLEDLPHIDPTTLEPVEVSVWDAVLAQVAAVSAGLDGQLATVHADADRAEGSAADAAAARSAAAGSARDSAAAADSAADSASGAGGFAQTASVAAASSADSAGVAARAAQTASDSAGASASSATAAAESARGADTAASAARTGATEASGSADRAEAAERRTADVRDETLAAARTTTLTPDPDYPGLRLIGELAHG